MTTNVLVAVVTAYVATGHPCADGHKPVVGVSVALPRCYPLGSRVCIGGRWYVGGDRTARRFDGRFDVFMGSRAEALKWGKRTMEVVVITK